MMVTLTFFSAPLFAETPKLLYDFSIDQAPTISFGWFKSFSNEQMMYYSAAQLHAVVYAEVGEKVKWQHGDAHGVVQVFGVEPTGIGYCKHVLTVVYAFGKKESLKQAACHTYRNKSWAWHNLE
jgi:hypothetical protein